MARIEIAAGVVDDFDRILDHLFSSEAADPPSRMTEIALAIEILATSPNIGRPAHGDLRELIIGKGSHGYVALYRYVPAVETVFVLAIRRQREAGYRERA